jgi:hypothetical protein
MRRSPAGLDLVAMSYADTVGFAGIVVGRFLSDKLGLSFLTAP